ncbi:PRTRC system protein B [Noviherbaspirillum sp. CPCC 100848]|uniref:PRTRC system protein B n=1 Tax=Noviherbaspirillum album TaxID=3080276 RepID=A0ABU6J9Y7_9BURK|nr:PRTRC system protein B [Noviherbaspirillum sp. CPCC 100848]MEC4720431.1 PRTRC system protein B [Noviherbaspirillum sp. CPCC 100848]
MNVSVHQTNPSYKAQAALLLYGSNPGQIDLVTVNPVVLSERGLVIKEGHPATKQGILEMLGDLSERVRVAPRLFGENILASSDDFLMWWEPAARRHVAFNCTELGKRAAETPQPPLLFAVARSTWYVFALPENARPESNTKLLKAPYFNVWGGGNICAGTTKIPTKNKSHSPAAWTEAFFSSAFTHPNQYGQDALVKYEHGCYAFWRDMLDQKFATFPTEVLVPEERTVASLLKL